MSLFRLIKIDYVSCNFDSLKEKHEESEMRAETAEREVTKLKLEIQNLEDKLQISMSQTGCFTEEMLKEIEEL